MIDPVVRDLYRNTVHKRIERDIADTVQLLENDKQISDLLMLVSGTALRSWLAHEQNIAKQQGREISSNDLLTDMIRKMVEAQRSG